MKVVALSGLVFGVLFAWSFLTRRATWAVLALGAFAFVSWSQINPLQAGIAPLSGDSLVQELRQITPTGENSRAMVFGDFSTVAKVRAAGLQSISGTTAYPDTQLMTLLAPDQELLWNNYAQYRWIPAAAGSSPEIERINGSSMSLTIDPCDLVIADRVHPAWAISEEPLDAKCLVPAASVRGHDQEYFVYTVTSGD